MRNLFVAVLTILGLAVPTALTVPTAEASTTAYTYLQYIDKGVKPSVIIVGCHNYIGQVMNLGQTSKAVCGGEGWVDWTQSPSGVRVRVRNINTGNITTYGCNVRSGIGGGYYDGWLVPC